MDPTRFDGLTRWLVRSVTRRRLAATVAAAVAVRETAVVAFELSCPGDQCHDSSNGTCHACTGDPSTDDWIPQCCGQNCCYKGSYCAVKDKGFCCPVGQKACQIPSRPDMVPICHVGGSPDPTCAPLGPEYDWVEDVCNCRRCPGGTPCGIPTTCCGPDQTCENGTCVDVCAAARRSGKASAASGCCPAPGMIVCKGTCVLMCANDQILNMETCSCQCVGETCGDACCPLGERCLLEASEGDPPVCCPTDRQACGSVCLKPGEKCCKHKRYGFRGCPQDSACCFGMGAGCCAPGLVCKNSVRCVKKRKKGR